jgi:triacylglycerol lipase
MPDANCSLTPSEAALAANNVYYTLKGWSAYQAAKRTGASQKPQPSPGMERSEVIRKEVVGTGVGSLKKAHLRGSLTETFEATTGIGTRSGFGYILHFNHGEENHVIVATRGTRPEIGSADLITDLYFTPTDDFLDAGLVHRGFALTFESLRRHLDDHEDVFQQADHIHCVGHSLGGAVANLVAYYMKSSYANDVRLYTFGAPRVGTYFGLPGALEKKLGESNIYRVSHQLDPITMIPTFPFLHVLGGDDDRNNLTLRSPSQGPSMKNHSMDTYLKEMTGHGWAGIRAMKYLPSFEDRLMKNLWESESDSWFKKGLKLAGASAVWVLMKVLKGILKLLTGAITVFIATPLDLIARLLYSGVQQLGKLGKLVLNWITTAAEALGCTISSAADVTTAFLRYLLERLSSAIRTAAIACLDSLAKMPPQAFAPFPAPIVDMRLYGL